MWDPVRRHLPEELPLIAYDLPGHRHSLHAEGRGGAGKMAKALLADLEARGLASFHLAGHSMGGAVAALIAMRAGPKVGSLTLLAPGGMGPEINAHALENMVRAKKADDFRAVMRVMVADGFEMPDPVINEMVAERTRSGAEEALADVYAAMFTEQSSPVKAQGVLPLELLERLACKVTVMWGEDDAILPFHQMDRLPESFHTVHLGGIGHMLLDECPQKVAEELALTVG